jgi:nitroreductase
MDVFEAMLNRRSVRKLLDTPIPREDLDRILDAARFAPSWANTQCQEIVLVCEPKTKQALAELLSERNPARSAVIQAPVVIVACGRKSRAGFKAGLPVTALGDWLMFDMGLFLQNLTLAAHALGYGTVHVGYFDHQKAGELIGAPADVQVVEILPLGRPATTPAEAPGRRLVADFTHEEGF